MARPKKEVSKKMAKLLAQQAELKAFIKENKEVGKAFVKASNKLREVEYDIEELKDTEAAKADK